MIESFRSLLDEVIQRLAVVQVVSLHNDTSIKRGERIIIVTLAEDMEAKFR